jgi:hypothetical protein
MFVQYRRQRHFKCGRQMYIQMLEDGIPPSLRGSVETFVASRGIPTRGHGVGHVGIFVGTRLLFHFSENALGMRLAPHGLVDGPCGLVLGFHTHKEE